MDRRHRWASPITEATRDRDYHVPQCVTCGITAGSMLKVDGDPGRFRRIVVRTMMQPSPLWWRLTRLSA